MCLAIPGKVVDWIERDSAFARAQVDFDGIRREVGMLCVPDCEPGDYVLVHAGIAISRIDPEEAARTLEMLAELDER